MARRPRLTRRLLTESAILTRGAAHILEVLRARHPQSDDLRIAWRAVLEFEAAVTEDRDRLSAARSPAPAPGVAPDREEASA